MFVVQHANLRGTRTLASLPSTQVANLFPDIVKYASEFSQWFNENKRKFMIVGAPGFSSATLPEYTYPAWNYIVSVAAAARLPGGQGGGRGR